MLPEHIQIACDIANKKIPANPESKGIKITGAKKDLNAKGRGPEWYRMVYRGNGWSYVSRERLPRGNYLAAERRATVYGEVYEGEIIVEHDRGEPISGAKLVTNNEIPLTEIEFFKQRDGNIKFILPDKTEIILPDPR